MIVPMTLAHLNFIVNQMDQAQWDGIQCLYEDKDKETYVANMYRTPGIKVSVIEDGEVWVCGGIMFHGNSTGTIWMAHRPGWNKYLRQTIDVTRRIIKSAELRNIKALVLESSKENNNWIKHLGFKFIGLDEQLGDGGESFNIYSHVRGKA
jgi:hypothetical protein